MPATGNVVLDTSVVVAHLRGVQAVTSQMGQAAGLYLPAVALGELLYGIRKSARASENLSGLHSWLATVTVLSTTEATAEAYATIKDELARAGTPIPENDIWIVAHAREHGLPLAARDDHFRHVTGVAVLDWR